jgi:hypothetical protein
LENTAEISMRACLTVLSIFLLAAAVCAQSDLAFPQIAVGGSPAYETLLQVINEVDAVNAITVDVFQGSVPGTSNGQPLQVRFDGSAPASSYTVSLTPYQELTIKLTGADATLRNGWLRLRSGTSGGKVSGSVIFRQKTGSSLVDTVGAPSPQRFRRGVVLVDQREAGSDTGIAMANTTANPVTVVLDLFQGADRAVSPVSVTLQAGQHFARLVSEIFPAFGSRLGTLIVEAPAGIAIPCMALRLDGGHLTSIPVRPLGFVFQYTVANSTGAVVEKGLWMFDLLGFNLVGQGKVESPGAADIPEVSGSWVGTNFQFRYAKSLTSGGTGMVVFNGTSAGSESTVDSAGRNKVIAGKVTVVGADGQVVSVNDFTAFHRYGPAPQ